MWRFVNDSSHRLDGLPPATLPFGDPGRARAQFLRRCCPPGGRLARVQSVGESFLRREHPGPQIVRFNEPGMQGNSAIHRLNSLAGTVGIPEKSGQAQPGVGVAAPLPGKGLGGFQNKRRLVEGARPDPQHVPGARKSRIRAQRLLEPVHSVSLLPKLPVQHRQQITRARIARIQTQYLFQLDSGAIGLPGARARVGQSPHALGLARAQGEGLFQGCDFSGAMRPGRAIYGAFQRNSAPFGHF